MSGYTQLPSVHSVVSSAEAQPLVEVFGRAALVASVREALGLLRDGVAAGRTATCDETSVLRAAGRSLEEQAHGALRAVFNLTGTVLHTNLGRAPLPMEAIQAIARTAGACNLEFDLATGKRGHRDEHVEQALVRLTGAQAASVVNNNAAGVMLLVNAVANGKEVLVSRGELVEIGGGFRIPEVIARSGARLREVGATNRTHLKDYLNALSARTGAILKVHRSNFELRGFTSEPEEAELAALAQDHGVPFIVDLGSGALCDLARFGLPREPTPMDSLSAGADAVCFSGDKLLGGPQAGMIVGRQEIIDRVRSNPLMRAVRCDKLSLAALSAVLNIYANPERVAERVPALRLLARSQAEIMSLARELHPCVAHALEGSARVEIVTCASQIGSGAQPARELDSAGFRLAPIPRSGMTAGRLAAALRRLPAPIIGRIQGGAVMLDLRCLESAGAFIAQMEHLRESLTGAGWR
ncbi:MAG: L-seryl-tRNA(Sec) selenium transferase [Beijerinckiaceae bacterium]